MFIGLLSFLFSITCILIILLVLIQKGKSGLGIGALGGGQQMLFGGAGGQDIFQKATWILGAVLILGSLGLSMAKSKYYKESSRYIKNIRVPAQQMPVAPTAPQTEQEAD